MTSRAARRAGSGRVMVMLAVLPMLGYFNVSYDSRTDLTRAKLNDCRSRLERLRSQPTRRLPVEPGGVARPSHLLT